MKEEIYLTVFGFFGFGGVSGASVSSAIILLLSLLIELFNLLMPICRSVMDEKPSFFKAF